MTPADLRYGDMLRNIHGIPYSVKSVQPSADGGYWVETFGMNRPRLGGLKLPFASMGNFSVHRDGKQIWPEVLDA